MDWQDKVAVVTGGASGIGFALAEALATRGVNVAIADIRFDAASEAAARIASGSARAFVCDVSDLQSVDALSEDVETAIGPVDFLFANAGATSFEPLLEMSDEEIDWMIQVNLMGAMHSVRAFLPGMIARGRGHVVATASLAGMLPQLAPLHVPYSAAKAAVIAMMLNLRREIAGSGVSCSVLVPGGVESGMAQNNPSYRPKRFGGPQDGPLKVPEEFLQSGEVNFRSASEVATMVLQAIEQDRPMVVTDPQARQWFEQGYANEVARAFDALDRFEAERGPA